MDQSLMLEPQLLDHSASDLSLSTNSENMALSDRSAAPSPKLCEPKLCQYEPPTQSRALQCVSLNGQLRAGSSLPLDSCAPYRRHDEEVCMAHNKVLDIICTDDRALICSSCAIFCHRGHEFKSLKDFEADKLGHCQQLLELTEAKKTLEGSICGEQATLNLREQFETLKSQLAQQIKNKFKTIIELANLAQERCLQRVYRGLIQEEERVKSLMCVPIRILETYKKWETVAYEQIRVFENQKDMADQMRILNYGGRLSDGFLGQGQTIIQELKKYQLAISNKLTDSLTSFTLEFDPSIQKRLSTVQDSILKKYKKLPLIDTDCSSSVHHSMLGDQSLSEDLLQAEQKQTFSVSNFEDSNSSHTMSTRFLPSMIKANRRSSSVFDDNVTFIPELTQMSQLGQATTSTLRFPVSPTQRFGLASPRGFVSPNKHREPMASTTTMDQRIRKILVRLKLPDKYQKLVSAAICEVVEVFDLTNCGLDENTVSCILELAKSNKTIRSLKLIRNRITDEGLEKIIPHLANISTLNLSQNHLSEKALDLLYGNLHQLPQLRNVILTQNKIKEKALKLKLDEFKRSNVAIVI